MRESTSTHTFAVSLRRNPNTGYLLPSSADVDFVRLAEHLSNVSAELESDPEPPVVQVKSKKRLKGKGKGKAVPENQQRPAKRLKLDDDLNTAELQYTQVQVLKHIYEIDFSIEGQADSAIEDEQHLSNERDIIHSLIQKHDERGDGAVEIRTLFPHAYGGSVQLCTSDPLAQRSKNPLPFTSFLKLPKFIDEDVKDSDFDFHSRTYRDILAAAYIMQQNNRARVLSQMEIIFTSPLAEETPELKIPFKFRVEISVSLTTPTVFEPLYPVKKKAVEVEEAQRRVLTYVFGPGLPQPEDYPKSTNVPFLLSCLKAAPGLSSSKALETAQPTDLRAKLLPFQKRGVAWLLKRERKKIDADGRLINLTDDASEESVPPFWEKVSPIEGTEWYLNRITGRISDSAPPSEEFLGGILADEPGLGKTLESIALVLLNPSVDRNPSISKWDPVGVIDVKEIKTTLIVTPNSLAQQWVDELKTHAPSLKVFIYEGWTKVPVPITEREARENITRRFAKWYQQIPLGADDIIDEDDMGEIAQTNIGAKPKMTWCDFINQYDVCITTYTALQQDLGVARPPIQRPRREVATYETIERDRSPLVMVEWHRVIMDEVQMVGGGKTEEMVSLIPRVSSFAVSGTPARSTVDDLIHVLNFLRVGPVINYLKVWSRLQKPGYAGYFKELFEHIAIRTVKSKVQDELTIPKQERFVVPVELGRVERHIYEQNLEQALNALGLDERGIAASSGWQIDVTLLRTWMRKLRGICTHPQVGQLSRQNDKLAKAGAALKSIAEVLENMKDQNWRSLMDEKKSKAQAYIKKARLVQHNDSNERRYHEALDILLQARTYMETILAEIRDAIVEHNEKGEILKREAAARRASGKQIDIAGPSKGKGKEKQRDGSLALTEDSVDDDLPKNPAGEEHRHKKSALAARFRENNIVMHHIHFLLGDVYHALGETHEHEENEAYAAAQEIRRKLLKTTEETAVDSIASLKLSASKNAVSEKDVTIGLFGKGGIKSDYLLREADEISTILNNQSALLFEWRGRVLKLLTESLSVNEDQDADGQEYARTLDTQGEAEALLQAYSALLADRREVLIAERTALAAHDVRERKIRHTAAAIKAAAALDKTGALQDDELQPEHEVMQKDFAQARKDIKQGYEGRAMRSIVVDLAGVCGSIPNDKDPEKVIAKNWATKLRSLIKEQLTFHDKLEADLTQFRKAFNDRVSYFRQLQELSDTVAEVDWEGSLKDAIQRADASAVEADAAIDKHRARQRYLNNLVDQDEDEEDDNTCILCKSEFLRGFITQCAHVFCESCFKAWHARKEGKSCPVCRVIIDTDQLQRITMKDKKEPLPVTVEPSGKQAIPKSKRVIEYNTIDKNVFNEIQKVETIGSYGSKIETLVRHLLYLQEVDPGCKSIVFSAWADSLFILERALTSNSIGCLRIDQRKGKQNASKTFKDDPKMLVLLLHGERENAGLNITCASRVFLLESVVQHSFEIQAIARIDRMGQTRPTEVYCYYAENTVERGILDLAAKRGLSLYTKDHAEGTLKVTSFEMDKNEGIDGPAARNSKKQKGDFIGKVDDMLEILFPWMFETEIEYLFPDDEDVNGSLMDLDDVDSGDEGDFIDEDGQPLAGPSRT